MIMVKMPGREPFYEERLPSDTIGTLTQRICDRVGVDKENWGMYQEGGQRVFLPRNLKLSELDSTKTLHFLPRTVIR